LGGRKEVIIEMILMLERNVRKKRINKIKERRKEGKK